MTLKRLFPKLTFERFRSPLFALAGIRVWLFPLVMERSPATLRPVLFLLLVFGAGGARGEFANDFDVSEIRRDHPRMFLNETSFDAVRKRALDEERALFLELKKRVDSLVGEKIEFSAPLEKDGTQNNDHEYGTRAAEAAFVYLVLGDEKYFNLSKSILTELGEYYTFRNAHGLNINWFAFSRINALAAYDWIYRDLAEEERINIGEPLLRAIDFMYSADARKPFFRENKGTIKTGFYGPPCLAWYAGLAFHGTGIDEDLSERLLREGYDDHIALLEHRRSIAGDDGGAASAVLEYCAGAYPWAEFNFFHTFSSSTGRDIAKEWPHVPAFINYLYWNWLPGEREFGYGDAFHIDNKLSVEKIYSHLSQLNHFYAGTHPELISMARWMQSKIPAEKQRIFPFVDFLLTNIDDSPVAGVPFDDMPKARHFDNMGQVFMRSGSGDHDTYAMFSSGGLLSQHRHYDNNNFLIYRDGFLALDSGTRPQPGLHLSHYYARTVAHNCITIKMPGETIPQHWDSGPALNEVRGRPFPNDGGQNNLFGSRLVAFDEKDEYVYLASDATESYHKEKAGLVLRQFVFIPPDLFVIFDRVNSKKPEYAKRWLLHLASEPTIENDSFSATHQGGRLFCRTLFPDQAELAKIGGEGKQFWSDGSNWALPELTPDDWNYEKMDWLDNDHDLFGQWRIEVSPSEPGKDDVFLHFIQVGDASLKSMVSSQALKEGNVLGLRFRYLDCDYKVMFNSMGEAGGEITIERAGVKIIDERLSDAVKPQKGLY